MDTTLAVYAICGDCGNVAEEDELSYCTVCGQHICERPLTEKESPATAAASQLPPIFTTGCRMPS
jgi:hypothetical protein